MAEANQSSEDDPQKYTEGKVIKDTRTLDAQRMFENIALSNARIKNQQQNENDPPMDERIEILSELFNRTPAVFLERFHPYLCEDDLQCFDTVSDVYEISFYLKEVRRRLAEGKTSVVVKNRRYEALKRLEREGTYFSDDEMRAREPLMYEQLIGQYLTDEERAETRTKIDQTDVKFSTILMSFMEDQETKALYKRQLEREEEAEEEEEEDEDSEKDDSEDQKEGKELGQTKAAPKMADFDDDDDDDEEEEEMIEEDEASASHQRQPTPATEAEKLLLREEFESIMRERFLSGKDKDFDYGAVDGNVEYDSLAIRGWDEEEKYFDDEEPCEAVGGRDNAVICQTRTDQDELDDYEKWTPEDEPVPMDQ